jgi:hypothetical protein
MSKRNYTRELRRAKEQGAKIVCSVAPFHGVEVEYMPRQKGDPQPWRISGHRTGGLRYSGRECQAVWPLAITGSDTPQDGFSTHSGTLGGSAT